MTQTAAVATATAALVSVVVPPPAVPGGRFRTVETRRVQGLEFEEQARVIEEFTCRYNVEHIGIDVTGGNGEAVYQIVKRFFFPAAIPYTFTLSSKRSLVLKMLANNACRAVGIRSRRRTRAGRGL